MRKIVCVLLFIVSAIGLLSGCNSAGDRKRQPQGRFMENDPGRTVSGSSKNYFARERERKRQYEREFRDVRRPMNQDHFQVMPWSGKRYAPRSESLHDSSLEENNSLFKF